LQKHFRFWKNLREEKKRCSLDEIKERETFEMKNLLEMDEIKWK
jgi:hypothetical protein